jgi:hypothetical protein
MKIRFLLIFITLSIMSCQTLPKIIEQTSSPAGQKKIICPSPFLKEQYRFIHSIEVRMAGDARGAIIGVTLADPATRFVSCAIMTAEGMVLFEAESNATLKVKRALPPFDSADFAKNMIDDIKLIFFAPEGKLQARGTLADGATICRYLEDGGDWEDVIARPSDVLEIKKYAADASLKRQIKLNRDGGNYYQRIELQAIETFNYSLIMTLIEAEPIEGEIIPEKNKGDDE